MLQCVGDGNVAPTTLECCDQLDFVVVVLGEWWIGMIDGLAGWNQLDRIGRFLKKNGGSRVGSEPISRACAAWLRPMVDATHRKDLIAADDRDGGCCDLEWRGALFLALTLTVVEQAVSAAALPSAPAGASVFNTSRRVVPDGYDWSFVISSCGSNAVALLPVAGCAWRGHNERKDTL